VAVRISMHGHPNLVNTSNGLDKGVAASPHHRHDLPCSVDFLTTDDGIQLAYLRRGQGPPVIACGGGPANDHRYLSEDLDALTDTFELVFHDYRGSGASEPADPTTYTLRRLGADVAAVRSEVGIERAAVLGHSMGGFVAVEYALRNPEHCAGLVLAGTWPTNSLRMMMAPTFRALGPARTAKMAARLVAWPFQYGWRPRTAEAKRRGYAIWSTMQEGEPTVRRAEANRELHLGLPMPNDNVQPLQREFPSWDFTDELSDIRCPVLVVYGARDAMAVAGAHWLRALPDVRVCELDRVGHDPFFEAPDRSLPIVREFLDELSLNDPQYR
jgi:proline iminopeptidase